MLTGRRHSAQSFYHDVVAGSIPPPNATYAMTLAAFARRGQFTERETVALLGSFVVDLNLACPILSCWLNSL